VEFDAVSKYILDTGPRAWLALTGRATSAQLTAVDSDLSTVTANADKFFCVEENPPWLVNFEPFSSRDANAPKRICLYSILGLTKLDLPIFTVVILLSRRAEMPEWTGEFSAKLPGDSSPYLNFQYSVVRVWELAPELLLEGGIATLALAPISRVSKNEVPAVLKEVLDRVDVEVPFSERRNYRAAIGTLMGLVHDADFVKGLFKDFSEMRESSVAQIWLEEGREEGREEGIFLGEVKAKHDDLLLVLSTRFGEVGFDVTRQLETITDAKQLTTLMRLAISDPDLPTFLERLK
jgi:hypothetical protein